MTDAGYHLPGSANVHLFYGELALVMTNHAQESVGVEVDRPHIAVLAAGHHHVVGHAQDGVDGVRVARKLVTVQPVLVLTRKQII